MKSSPIITYTGQRSFLQRILWPVVLIQYFNPCNWSNMNEYLSESDRFHMVLDERIFWMKKYGIHHKISYSKENANSPYPSSYKIEIKFRSKLSARKYKSFWKRISKQKIDF